MLKPQPRVTEINRPFWEACNAGQLKMQRCAGPQCGKLVFYPRVCCPYCHGAALDWVDVANHGSIISHTTIHRPHHDGFASELPYVFAAIDIDGAIIYAQVLDAPTDGQSLIGREADVEFVTHSPQQKMPVFRLRGN